MLRISGGLLRGRRIRAPAGKATRPTGDRVREALFAILGSDFLAGARAVDLFAGSGALGLEALSRGAASCIFVENNHHVAQLIRGNLAALDLEERARVMVSDGGRALPRLVEAGPFDLILADPPYEEGHVERVLELTAAGLLASEGWLVMEHSLRERPAPSRGLGLRDRRKYGRTEISFLTLD